MSAKRGGGGCADDDVSTSSRRVRPPPRKEGSHHMYSAPNFLKLPMLGKDPEKLWGTNPKYKDRINYVAQADVLIRLMEFFPSNMEKAIRFQIYIHKDKGGHAYNSLHEFSWKKRIVSGKQIVEVVDINNWLYPEKDMFHTVWMYGFSFWQHIANVTGYEIVYIPVDSLMSAVEHNRICRLSGVPCRSYLDYLHIDTSAPKN